MFNSLLKDCDVDPSSVLLVRHQERGSNKRTPYSMWRDESGLFEDYQSRQSVGKRSTFSKAKIWASFVVTPQSETLFVGLFDSEYLEALNQDWPHPLGGTERAGEIDIYKQSRSQRMSDLSGRLVIDWGPGFRQWTQWADNKDKPILELRRVFKEPDFPGFSQFIQPLSHVDTLPVAWVEVLKNSRGVYLLTCPKTKEQYVGSAYGADGFWGRWNAYACNGHGGNLGLKNRDKSDYQVSILEVANSSADITEIIGAEELWKKKLQSREMGLNL